MPISRAIKQQDSISKLAKRGRRSPHQSHVPHRRTTIVRFANSASERAIQNDKITSPSPREMIESTKKCTRVRLNQQDDDNGINYWERNNSSRNGYDDIHRPQPQSAPRPPPMASCKPSSAPRRAAKDASPPPATDRRERERTPLSPQQNTNGEGRRE